MPNTDDDAPPDMKVARKPQVTTPKKPEPPKSLMQRLWIGVQVIAGLAVFVVVGALIQKCSDTLSGYQ